MVSMWRHLFANILKERAHHDRSIVEDGTRGDPFKGVTTPHDRHALRDRRIATNASYTGQSRMRV